MHKIVKIWFYGVIMLASTRDVLSMSAYNAGGFNSIPLLLQAKSKIHKESLLKISSDADENTQIISMPLHKRTELKIKLLLEKFKKISLNRKEDKNFQTDEIVTAAPEIFEQNIQKNELFFTDAKFDEENKIFVEKNQDVQIDSEAAVIAIPELNVKKIKPLKPYKNKEQNIQKDELVFTDAKLFESMKGLMMAVELSDLNKIKYFADIIKTYSKEVQFRAILSAFLVATAVGDNSVEIIEYLVDVFYSTLLELTEAGDPEIIKCLLDFLKLYLP